MRVIIYILAFLIGLSSCSISIRGLYKHEICGNSPDCFLFDFCKDGRFTYWYSQDILGSATLSGHWTRKGDTLFLKADQYLFDVKTNLICSRIDSSDLSIIEVGLLRKYFKNHKDTTFMNWLIKIDNEDKIYETDDMGILKLSYRPIEKITVRDYLTSLGIKPMIEIEDSVFNIPRNSNKIKIYVTDNKLEPCILWDDREMIIKWRKLISVLPDSMANYRPDRFIKVKNKCGNIKDE